MAERLKFVLEHGFQTILIVLTEGIEREMDTLRFSYETCAKICSASNSNFTAAFRTLSPAGRQAMEAIYAFMHTADDLVDSTLPTEERAAQLERFQEVFLQNLSEPERFTVSVNWESEPEIYRIFPAVVQTIHRCSIPQKYFLDVLAGIRMDLETHFYRTAEDLEKYCYHVASAVGLICLHVWGVPPQELLPDSQTPIFRAAVKCGKALQWTNILRDVREDAENGRFYLPLNDWDEVSELGETLDWQNLSDERKFEKLKSFAIEGNAAAFLSVLELNLRRAEEFYREAELLEQWIPKKNRRIFRLITGVYFQIFLKIRRNPGQIFKKRVRLSEIEKLLLCFRVIFR